MHKKILIALVAVAAASAFALASAAVAQAGDAGTIRISGVASSPGELDCRGNLITVSLRFDGALHVNASAGGYHNHIDLQGDVAIIPDDPSLPTYLGHFAMHDGMNLDRITDTATFTFSAEASAADGSTIRFSAVNHTTVQLDGTVDVQFERFRERDTPGGRCAA